MTLERLSTCAGVGKRRHPVKIQTSTATFSCLLPSAGGIAHKRMCEAIRAAYSSVCFQSVLFQPLAPAVEPHHTYLCGLYLHIPNLQRPSQTFSEGSYLRVTSMSSFFCCYICIPGCRQFAVRGTYLMPPEWKKFKNRAWRSTWHLTVLWRGRGCPVMRQRGHTTFILKQGLLHPKLVYVAKDSSQNLIPPVLASWDYGFSGAQIKGFCKVSE